MEARAAMSAAAPAADASRVLLDEALAECTRHHRAGDLASAAELYGCSLGIDPCHPQALQFSGVIAHPRGAHDLARSLAERSSASAPDYAAAHNTLGAVQLATGDLSAAARSLDTALALAPRYADADALQNYGQLHEARGNRPAAIACYRQALEIGPRTTNLLTVLGLTLEAEDCRDDACSILE